MQVRTAELIAKHEQTAYENEQRHSQMQFNLAKQRRVEEKMASSRLVSM
tara:strand:+ start:125 stop:271 length:147 start_codon:yes stop_codon:yes gene_type:complete